MINLTGCYALQYQQERDETIEVAQNYLSKKYNIHISKKDIEKVEIPISGPMPWWGITAGSEVFKDGYNVYSGSVVKTKI